MGTTRRQFDDAIFNLRQRRLYHDELMADLRENGPCELLKQEEKALIEEMRRILAKILAIIVCLPD